MNHLPLTPARIILYFSAGATAALAAFQILLFKGVVEFTADTAPPFVEGYSYPVQSVTKVGKIRLGNRIHNVWVEQEGDTRIIYTIPIEREVIYDPSRQTHPPL